eukprot:m.104982 g.104982  ORF g.104982 m.104982 type:complete len:285 (+) comp15685_c0_seq1:660-1514(+)
MASLLNKVAVVTGATRGIGRVLALRLAAEGCNVVVSGKTTEETDKVKGTIFTVAQEVEEAGRHAGVRALPVQCDVRSDASIKSMVDTTVETFGSIDILINNAGALWWKDITETPPHRYDLIHSINSRAAYSAIHYALPHMIRNGYGHILVHSPPIVLDNIGGKTAYFISKFGMTLSALGVAQELKGTGVAANSFWPTTMIESAATIVHKLGDRSMWRTPEIIADMVVEVLKEDPTTFTGNQLLDEPYLRSKGYTDFERYRCDPDTEPPKMNEIGKLFDRGSAKL